jgi:hypothetical protein
MFHEVADEPGSRSAEELYRRLEAELVDVVDAAGVDAAGVDAVAADAGLDRETLAALVDGESPELTLEEAAAILATAAETPPADAIVHESRDALLLGMTSAVLDVEALASELDGDLEPREIQSKVEGRFPLTLREFAALHAEIQSSAP